MNIQTKKEEFDKAVDFFKKEISNLRTGRANTAMVEDIAVNAYGARQPLKTMASITVADSKTLNVEPWDKGLLGEVEKAIRDSDLGINPVNDGHIIRVILPELSSERRQELVKVLGQKSEHARIAVRKIREEIRDEIGVKEKNKEISEDEKYGFQEELEKLVKETNENIKEIENKKEEEISKV